METLQLELNLELVLKLEVLAEKQGKTIESLIIEMLHEQILVKEVRESFGMSTGMVRFKENG